jgi:sensor c-di-GMP phosphodiesterase-like protein
MNRFNRRISIAFLATSLASTGGLLAGYWLSRTLTLHAVETKLQQDAAGLNALTLALQSESRTILTNLDAAPYPYCSDAEIAYLRELIYKAKYVRDAGHIRDGRVECSSTLGRENLPQTQFKPAFALADGTLMYRDLSSYPAEKGAGASEAAPQIGSPAERAGGPYRPTLSQQIGNSFVVFDSSIYDRGDAISKYLSFTMTDLPSQKSDRVSGLPLLLPGAVVDRDAHGRVGDVLYVTICERSFSGCGNAFASIPDALNAARWQQYLLMGVGGVTSGLLGFLLSILDHRSRGMARQLRRAIRKDKLRVVYQPIVELAGGRIVEAEALVRWTDADGLAVRPDVFVGIAEQRGFVGELTRLVVRKALADLGYLLRSSQEFRLNINVTATDLADTRFLPMLMNALAEAGVEARRLAIEITESSTASKLNVRETIRELQRLGHSVQIDDFGTGYSSLSYLNDLAVDAIKIDQSFTRAIGTDAVTVGILPQILAMAEALDLEVIVEGIETAEQAAYFAALARPVLAQGWFYGRPVAAEEFKRRLEAEGTRVEAPADAA